jgi:hypothetical protein
MPSREEVAAEMGNVGGRNHDAKKGFRIIKKG